MSKKWFDDPFFKDDDFDKEFKKMEKEMNKMFSSKHEEMEYEERRSHKTKPRVQELDEHGNEKPSGPIIEEPDDEKPKHKTKKTYYYSSSTSYTNSNGVQHATKKTYDSNSGKTEVTEMRKIGDQAVTRRREIDSDGTVNDRYDMLNLDEGNVGEFNEKWNKSNTKQLKHDHKQLK